MYVNAAVCYDVTAQLYEKNMTFTSGIFLIGFLPWFLLLIYFFRKQIAVKNILILLVNSIFYIWGCIGAFLFLVCFSVCVWGFGNIIRNYRNRYLFMVFMGITVFPLLVVKYTIFIIGNLNSVLGGRFSYPEIIVPLGISFFTFQAISFLGDIYTGKITKKARLWEIYSYLSFFPTVTSGPILRFEDFQQGICNKIHSDCYATALERIVLGLCKKVLIADKVGILADFYFDGITAGKSFSCIGLWMGAIAYTIQIYFDFSGYSDMAIGMGQLLGISVKENFNHPYRASSISDFWKRWHISLSQWFRDYIYIPLGGNRCNMQRHVFNLWVVWLLTGIWHGAGWSLVLWGMGYFVLLTAEKYIPLMRGIGKKWYGHIYALFFINILWVFFRADSLTIAIRYVAGMFGIGTKGIVESKAAAFVPYLLLAAAFCLPWERVTGKYVKNPVFSFVKGVLTVFFAVLAVCGVISAAYATYIYGTF